MSCLEMNYRTLYSSRCGLSREKIGFWVLGSGFRGSGFKGSEFKVSGVRFQETDDSYFVLGLGFV